MKPRLYIDEDSMRQSLVVALKAWGVDVETAWDAGMIARPDETHLRHATEQGRVLYSFNVGDYGDLHKQWLASGREHAGIVLAQQRQFEMGRTLPGLLKLIAERDSDAMRNRSNS